MFCSHCGHSISEDDSFCVNCGNEINKSSSGGTPGQETFARAGDVSPPSQPSPDKKSKAKWVFAALFGGGAVLALLAAVILGAYFLLGGSDSKNIIFGDTTSLGNFRVSPMGSTLTVNNPSSTIDGFSIQIPEGAFGETQDFTVSETQVTEHRFGEIFNPATPLISINNDQIFSNKPMNISIPIHLEEGEFAMGFYYNRKSGKLEAIPFESLSGDRIVLRTSHFSDIIVSKITKEYLLSYDTSIDSEFRPGIDDWQFANYGSVLAPGGHCAGQALSMVWYFNTQKLHRNKPALYGLFDNNGKYTTSQFQEDDALGYRFASVIQDNFDFSSPVFYDYVDLSLESQENTYLSFAYSLLLTKSPQFMGIYHVAPTGEFLGGHAIVAYRLNNRKIYVADPNYPGKNDRYVAFGEQSFLPYSSGANAADISEGSGVLYNKIVFVGQTALVDFDTIDFFYSKMQDQTVGNDSMPTLSVHYMSRYSSDPNNIELSKLKDKVKYSDPSSFPEELKGRIFLVASTGTSDYPVDFPSSGPVYGRMLYTLYRGTTIVETLLSSPEDPNVYFEADLDSRVNDYGILAEVYVEREFDDGSVKFTRHFADFKRFEITYTARKENLVGFKAGDIISLGKLEQDNNPANGPEPIYWRILSVEGDRALVISENVIINHPYHDKEENVTWETSKLRYILNTQFYHGAFAEDEKQIILFSFVLNNNNSFDVPGGNNTFDNIFCLSIEEADFHFKNSNDRLAKNTASVNAVLGISEVNGTWWLRSPGRHPDRGANVSGISTDQYEFYINAGDVVETGTYGTNHRVHVRPAMWISLYDLAKTAVPTTPPSQPTQGGSVHEKIVGIYSLNEAGTSSGDLDFWIFEIKSNGTYEASYKGKDSDYVGGWSDTWEVVEKSGEYWIHFFVDGDLDYEALVASNFSGFRIRIDDVPHYFEK